MGNFNLISNISLETIFLLNEEYSVLNVYLNEHGMLGMFTFCLYFISESFIKKVSSFFFSQFLYSKFVYLRVFKSAREHKILEKKNWTNN
jgi:hypothetical protein